MSHFYLHVPNSGERAFALGKHGIYKTLKYFLRTAAKRDITALKRKYKAVKGALDRALKRADVQKVARLQIKVRRLDVDAKVAQRRLTFSTHWMRHAFVKEVVRRNPDGAGLNYAQEALGHTSIVTTGAYLKQDISAMAKALRKVNPLSH